MDTNTYALERLVRAKLDELRAESARRVAASRASGQPLDIRALAGLALIRIGRRLARPTPARMSSASPGAHAVRRTR